MNSDRRRINGPKAETAPPVYSSSITGITTAPRPSRTRAPDELREIFLQTSLTPSASGSAYLELSSSTTPSTPPRTLIPASSTPKISVTVHGPRPLPRSAPFTPHLLLTTHVKFAPFAARRRRGYVRDAAERDLGAHLEAALRGVVIGERWPKSGVEVVVTVLEGEEDAWWGAEVGLDGEGGAGGGAGGGWGAMTVLAGCVTAASAALVEAGIDCVDLVAGGVAALVTDGQGSVSVVLDPSPPEHKQVLAACAVGYLEARDELTEIWMKGDVGTFGEELVDAAVKAAVGARAVLKDVTVEGAQMKFGASVKAAGVDATMSG